MRKEKAKKCLEYFEQLDGGDYNGAWIFVLRGPIAQ